MSGGSRARFWARIREKLDSHLRPRDRRALRWGALALAPALVWAAAVEPWLEAVDQRRDRLASLRTLARAEAGLLATGDRYPEAVEAGARRLADLAPRLLDRRSEGVAAAEVHQLVEDRARASRVHLTAVQPLGVRAAAPGLAAAAVEVQGESDLQGILAFLGSLGAGDKLLRVEGLRIRSAPDRSGHQVLAFRATVAGFLLELEGEGDATEDGSAVRAAGSTSGDVPGTDDARSGGASSPLAGRDGGGPP